MLAVLPLCCGGLLFRCAAAFIATFLLFAAAEDPALAWLAALARRLVAGLVMVVLAHFPVLLLAPALEAFLAEGADAEEEDTATAAFLPPRGAGVGDFLRNVRVTFSFHFAPNEVYRL